MSDITPPYWVGGNPGAAFAGTNAAVAANQANMLANYNANLAYVGAQNQASLNNAYGPQGFGGATAQNAYAGAAAGRNTGGYGGYGGMNDPLSPVGGYNSLDAQFDHAAAQQYLDQYNDVKQYATEHSLDPLWFANYHANTQGGSEGRNTFGLGATPFNDYGGGANPGGFSPSPNYPGGSAAASDPASQAYLAAYPDVAASGLSAAQHFALYGQAEGRNGFGLSAGAMNQGGDQSWLSAGQPGSGYNPLGSINSGLVGSQSSANQFQAPSAAQQQYLDAYPDIRDYATSHGVDPGAFATWHAQNQGNNEGRNTFGLTNANPNFQQGGGFGMGSAFDPATYGGSTGNPGMSFDQRFPAGAGSGSPGFGNYPQQPMASDNMYNQQQMYKDLYKTLGIIDNAGEFNRGDGAYNPSGNTLNQQDLGINWFTGGGG